MEYRTETTIELILSPDEVQFLKEAVSCFEVKDEFNNLMDLQNQFLSLFSQILS